MTSKEKAWNKANMSLLGVAKKAVPLAAAFGALEKLATGNAATILRAGIAKVDSEIGKQLAPLAAEFMVQLKQTDLFVYLESFGNLIGSIGTEVIKIGEKTGGLDNLVTTLDDFEKKLNIVNVALIGLNQQLEKLPWNQ